VFFPPFAPPPFFVFAAVFAVLATVSRSRARLLRRRRVAAMAALARSRGWSYAEEDITAYYGFSGPPFERGQNVHATDVMRGEHRGWRFTTFDYRFTTGQGRSRRSHVFAVTAVQTGIWLAPVRVAPETLGSQLVDHLTGDDIDTESEQFNKTFKVSCGDRKLAVDVLNPQMMQYLLQLPLLAWSLESGALVIASVGQNVPARIDYDLAVAEQILAFVPDFVWTEARVTPPHPPGP
jgi:hypothetical protein